jgi:ubiquinone/menaquinone biosynthesis C-methylase UbiE
MLEAAELRTGDHVLDIAAGTGDQSILVAEKVGPTGMVLATDISAAMIKEAARLASLKGFTNITTRVMNAEQLDLPDQAFDAVISRLGLMLIQKRHQAFLEIYRVLKPGRKLAALVWSTPDRHPYLSVPLTIIAKYISQPEDLSGPFSLSGDGVFEQALKVAGFREVHIQAIPLQYQFASTQAFVQLPLLTNAMQQLKPPDQQRFQQEVEQALRQFETPQGLVLPSEMLLGVGAK